MPETRLQRAVRRTTNDLLQRGWTRVRRMGAIAPGTRAAERFGSFGEGSAIGFPTATVYGEAQIHIGEETLIGCWITLATGYGPGQPTVPPRALVIGDRCVMGLRSGVVAHESIEIEDDVWFGQDVFVTDANHGFLDLDVPIGHQLGPHEPVRIGAGSWVGHGAVILPGTTIGRHVVVAAGSVVKGDVPDNAVVAGVPARVLRMVQPEDRGRPEDHPELAELVPRDAYAYGRERRRARADEGDRRA